jgi:hypothetical protein
VLGQARERPVEILDRDGDVAIADAAPPEGLRSTKLASRL